MSSRDDILAEIRSNLPKLDRPPPWVPMFDDSQPASLLDSFRESLLQMGGDFLNAPPGEDPLQPIRQRLADAKVVCSATPEVAGHPAWQIARNASIEIRARFFIVVTGGTPPLAGLDLAEACAHQRLWHRPTIPRRPPMGDPSRGNTAR